MYESPNSGPVFSTEVCVLGAGPAGAATALRLAQLGHRVLIVERAPPGRPHVGESLPPSVLPMLEALGLREQVEDAEFLRTRGAVVQWHDRSPVPVPVPMPALGDRDGEAGFQVDRARFDALLLDAAQAAGVRVLRASAGAPIADGARWRVPLQGGGAVRASVAIDARGRRAGVADGPRTAALYAYWEGPRAADSRTRVESCASSWCWGAPLPDGRVNAAVFLDARRCAALPPGGRAALYMALLDTSPLLRSLLGGRRAGAVHACDATPRAVADAAPAAGLLRVGEAAFCIDPLSSQGVPAALRSAVQAAVCVHTALERPTDADLAWRFHREQVERSSRRHARLAAQFHALAARRHEDPFWARRAALAGAAPARDPDSKPDSEPAMRPWPQLDQRLVLDAQARWCRMPAMEGEWVTARHALQHPSLDAPIAFLAEQPVADWISPLQAAPRLRDLLDLWHQRFGEARTAAIWPWLWRRALVAPAA